MSAAAALVLAMTFSAERSVQAAAGGRVEVLAGAVPDDPLRPSRAQMAVAVVPVVGLHVQRQRYEFTGLYRPRVFMRIPNRLDLKRPLLLHQGSLEHRLSWSRQTVWQNRLHLSIGEVDYALSAFVFDPAQPTVPTDEVTPLVRGQASSTLTHAVSRRTATGVTLFGAYNAPLYDEDETGFRTSARVEIAHKIVERAEALGIPREDVIIDCLTLSLGANVKAGLATLEATRRVRDELGVNQTQGCSNISHGLPNRPALTGAYLAMGIEAGLTCPTVDVAQVRLAILSADLVLGRDNYAMRFISLFREMQKAQEQ